MRFRSKASNVCEAAVAVTDGNYLSVPVRDSVKALQPIALADALASPTEFLPVCALEEDYFSAACGRRGLTELEQDL
jgi:hypothetical protein